MLNRRSQSGDTLIEVLFAVTVFSFIVVAALSLMNQGTAASQRALELTLVRQQVDGQAEALRFLHGSYVLAYGPGVTFDTTDTLSTPAEEYSRVIQKTILTGAKNASVFNKGGNECPAAPTGSFVIDPVTAKLVSDPSKLVKADTFAQLNYNTAGTTFVKSSGLWVEAVRSPDAVENVQKNVGYIDFHIRACWSVPGQSAPMNIGTIVRLYEPRG